MLTDREKWLMERAFEAACQYKKIMFDDWLDQDVADAVTVEMVLSKEAPC